MSVIIGTHEFCMVFRNIFSLCEENKNAEISHTVKCVRDKQRIYREFWLKHLADNTYSLIIRCYSKHHEGLFGTRN
jgi:hypothetical protein